MSGQKEPKPEDICPAPDRIEPLATHPLAPPIYPAAVYQCDDAEQARRILAGEEPGYVYSREGHPNGQLLAEKCRALHGADRAVICSSGMAALSAASLALLSAGDHVVASNQLYGRNQQLLTSELARYAVQSTTVDSCDLAATRAALRPTTRLVVVETISNPLLRVANIAALAEMVHAQGASLLVDNTFAGPTICRPLALGADLVLESLTKIMNGHSDVLLGALCGREACWPRIKTAVTVWGLSPSPFDCWLAARGIGTLALRAERASNNALRAAQFLAGRREVETVYYPGLPSHPDHALAARQFTGGFGSVVTFTLAGGRAASDRFIAAARRIAFCPSLGDLSTTLTHPETTSHRTLTPAARQKLGITGGTIRLSVGIESSEAVIDALNEGLAAV
ncbi:MAG TPA: aminotransferase class I/II-fold pyridoxal phosphate-dependent enzyme [Pirellulales bacterium]|jgi:cystathionine beta-lyase/cystathionine gamma-synthase|nr:aminotransferase class I/II-fold pyridoxal phosphate-dependent enzyme [Pirellulales bacterium]